MENSPLILFVCRFRIAICLIFFLPGFAGAQSSWPNAGISGKNWLEGGIPLKDGSFLTLNTNPSFQFLGTKRTTADGRITPGKAYAIGHYPTRMLYDSVHNRVFCLQFWSINSAGLMRHNIDSAFLAGLNGNFTWRNLQLYCLDTAGTLLWARNFSPGPDTMAYPSSMVLDGKGGVFVGTYYSGNFRSAFGPNARLGAGKFELVRIGAQGERKWARFWVEPVDSAVRSIGVHVLVARPKGQVESVKILTDTGTYLPGPGGQLVHIHRLDSNGTQLGARTAVFKGSGLADQSGPFLEFLPQRVGGETRFYYVGPRQTLIPEYPLTNCILLEFDSTLNFRRAFYLNSGLSTTVNSNLCAFPNGKIGISGSRFLFDPITNQSGFWRDFQYIDPVSMSVLGWHSMNVSKCGSAQEFTPSGYPILRQNANGSRSYDFLASVSRGGASTGKGSAALFRFKDGTEGTCYPDMIRNELPALPLPEATSLYSMVWRSGSTMLTRQGSGHNWRDTSFSEIPLGPVFARMTSLCDSLRQPFDTIRVCDTAAVVPTNILSEAFFPIPDLVRVNGVLVPNPAEIRITQSGSYVVERWDSCRMGAPYKDTLVVTLQTNPFRLSRDTISLCPGESQTVTALPANGFPVQWLPSGPLNYFTGPSRTFTGLSQFPGTYRIPVFSTLPDGTCPAFDTLVFRSKTPAIASLTVSDPDTLLRVTGNMVPSPNWTVNGGNPVVFGSGLSIRPQWGPFFEGQSARVIVSSFEGCLDTLTYKRVQVLDPPPPPPPPPPPIPGDSAILPFVFPTLVTQDANGRNDLFQILNQMAEDRVEIEFYDRWGNRVFTSSAYRGEFPERNQAPGVYFWSARIAFFRNKSQFLQRYSGWVTVLSP